MQVLGLIFAGTVGIATVLVMLLAHWDALPFPVNVVAVSLVIAVAMVVGISLGRTIEDLRHRGVIGPSIWRD